MITTQEFLNANLERTQKSVSLKKLFMWIQPDGMIEDESLFVSIFDGSSRISFNPKTQIISVVDIDYRFPKKDDLRLHIVSEKHEIPLSAVKDPVRFVEEFFCHNDRFIKFRTFAHDYMGGYPYRSPDIQWA